MIRMRPRQFRGFFVLFAVVAAAACSAPESVVTLSRSENSSTTSVAIGDLDLPYRDFLKLAIEDIGQYWADHYDEIYEGEYPQLSGGVHAATPQSSELMPSGCEYSGQYSYVEDNAFYCDEGDFIVYDDAGLFPDFAEEFGPLVTAVIMAHEWGHAIQSPRRNNVLSSLRGTTLELQADCFAGAWVGHVQSETIAGLAFSDADITGALLGMMQIGDDPGDSSYDPNAHGSGFDRVGAFQDGFVGGLVPCAEYQTVQPEPVQFGFTPEELLRPNPGDFPFDQEMFSALGDDLTLFWNAMVDPDSNWTAPTLLVDTQENPAASCTDSKADAVIEGVYYCAADSTVIIDEGTARRFYTATPGDFAVGYLVGLGFGEAVQQATGSELVGAARILLDSCYAGLWAGDIIPLNSNPMVVPTESEPRISLSPGDLDEAVRAALALTETSPTNLDLGSPFDRVDAFRQGVLRGTDGCDSLG